MAEKRNLVVNLIDLLVNLKDGLDKETLANALFYFNFPKEYLLGREHPAEDFLEYATRIFGGDAEKGRQALGQVVNYVKAAEEKGRAHFNDIGVGIHPTFRSLNEFLGENGVDVSSVRRLENTDHAHYCLHNVKTEYEEIVNVI